MTDLDFDELDQAVNSAMGSAMDSADETKTTQPSPVTSTDSIEKPVRVVSSRTSTPVAKRSTGRFMDVVHPSSDMRPSSKPEVDNTPVQTEEASEPEKPAQTSDWPDPLDFQGFKMDEPEEPVQKVDVVEKSDDTDSSDAPLSSPFLSDAKVQKRPLGAFSAAPDKADAAVTPDKTSTPAFSLPAFKLPGELKMEDSNKDGTTSKEPKSDQPIPPEFQDDLLSVESDASLTENASDDISPDTVKDASIPSSEEKSDTSAEKTSTPAPMPSIVQQYKEKAASADQSSGAIYDTETYHKPIATLPKKKTGLLIVLWIIGLIILGGGIGAAMYFYVLPLLV